MTAAPEEDLFDSDFLRKLERLELLAGKMFRGLVHGEHDSRRRGQGLEFSDYRSYQSGDDLRHIDWNIYSRLDRLFLKLYACDEDLSLHLLLDCSASMDFGQPRKFDYARRLTAALACIGLSGLDRVAVSGFAAAQGQSLPVLRGRAQFASLLPFLRQLRCGGTTGFAAAMHSFVSRNRSPGVVLAITDLLADPEIYTGLDALRYSRHDVVLLHLVAEEEIAPALQGAFNLLDSEDGSTLKVTVDAGLRQHYLDRLHTHLDELELYCRRHGVDYLRASTAIGFEDLVLKFLRQGRQWR